jgi:hypothetical protein
LRDGLRTAGADRLIGNTADITSIASYTARTFSAAIDGQGRRLRLRMTYCWDDQKDAEQKRPSHLFAKKHKGVLRVLL